MSRSAQIGTAFKPSELCARERQILLLGSRPVEGADISTGREHQVKSSCELKLKDVDLNP
jgi:hypothetical protein